MKTFLRDFGCNVLAASAGGFMRVREEDLRASCRSSSP